YSSYIDKPSSTTEQAREAFSGEIALGYRFGAEKSWAIGLLYNTGIAAYNSATGVSNPRPLGMLHVRYQPGGPLTNFWGICLRPFYYGDVGLSLDHAAINLLKFNLSNHDSCGECAKLINQLDESANKPNVDMGVPI